MKLEWTIGPLDLGLFFGLFFGPFLGPFPGLNLGLFFEGVARWFRQGGGL